MRTMKTLAVAAATTAIACTAFVAPASAATKSYTIAQVKTHKSSSNCWAAINGGVYNLTSWIPMHPGGAGIIKSLCGTDATAMFNGRHGGQSRPAGILATFKVGTLKK